jgi:hypothetical protein
MAIIIDTLKLARALRDKGGFSQEGAEATAEAFNEALSEQVATKLDIERAVHQLTMRTFAIVGGLNALLFALLRLFH